MNTTKVFITSLCCIVMQLINSTQAQVCNCTAMLDDSSIKATSVVAINSTTTPNNNIENTSNEYFTVEAQSGSMNFHKALPFFTNNARLVLKDFTSRVIKTYKLDTHSVANNEFYISDLLAGEYRYEIVTDNGAIANGTFIIRD